MSSYSRLVRFLPKSSSTTPLIGEPVNAEQDVGLASYAGETIEVDVFSGSSILNPGEKTGKKEVVERLLSPLAQNEVGTIRCIGLNVSGRIGHQHLSRTSWPGLAGESGGADHGPSTSTTPRRSTWPSPRFQPCSTSQPPP
jgi:hypothetical protein